MSGSETAAQRALAVPELLLHVFLELDNPGNFGRMARLWRQVARDPINLCKHFERRYYPFEILNELLRRPSVYMKVPELVESFLSRGATVSSSYVWRLRHGLHYTLDGLYCYYLPDRAPQGSRVHVNQAIYHQISAMYPSSDQMAEPVSLLQQVHAYTDTSDTAARRKLFSDTIGEHGLGYWNRSSLALLYCEILFRAGKDIPYCIGVLETMGGCPDAREASYCMQLSELLLTSYAHTIGPVETFHGMARLCTRLEIVVDWLPLDKHALRTSLQDGAMFKMLCQQSAPAGAYNALIVRLLSHYRPARLLHAPEAERFRELWLLTRNVSYPPSVRHLKSTVNALILWIHSSQTATLAAYSGKYLRSILSADAAVLLLSNPYHSPESFKDAVLFVVTNLPRKAPFERILQKVVDQLLGIHTSGAQILELSRRYSWIVPQAIDHINGKNVRYVVDEPELSEPWTDDPIELGVRHAMAQQSDEHPEWMELTPKTGFLPLAIALLSLLNGKGERAETTLDLIYAEAKKRKKEKIVEAFEAEGFGRLWE